MPIQSSGRTGASDPNTNTGTAVAKPSRWLKVTSAGAIAKPPALAPVSARLSASPRRRSKCQASVVEIAVLLAPAQPPPIKRFQL